MGIHKDFIEWYNTTYEKNITKERFEECLLTETFFGEDDFKVIYDSWLNIRNRNKKINNIKNNQL